MILARHRMPYYLPAGGSTPVGTLGYVEVGLEIAEQVAAGELPEPATIVSAVGTGGTVAGLALGLRLAGLSTRVFGAVVNDWIRLDAVTTSRLATKAAELIRSRGADIDKIVVKPDDLTATPKWMGRTYGASTPESTAALVLADRVAGLELEPVYTAKALAAILDGNIPGPVLYLNTHGPRPMA
jgi:D-cysteine desulfhydrase